MGDKPLSQPMFDPIHWRIYVILDGDELNIWVIIILGNGFASSRRQAITVNDDDIWSVGHIWTPLKKYTSSRFLPNVEQHDEAWWLTYKSVNWIIIGTVNGSTPVRWKAPGWTNADCGKWNSRHWDLFNISRGYFNTNHNVPWNVNHFVQASICYHRR